MQSQAQVLTQVDRAAAPTAPAGMKTGTINTILRVGLTGFFTFYYRYAGFLTGLMPSITLEGKTLHVPATVYKPLENEQRFRDHVNVGDRVCDLGCGCGVISVFVAEKADSVVALDIGDSAVEATRANCERHGLTNVEVHKSDMFAATDGVFDIICANPPFVEIPMKGEETQWATSVTYLTRLFAEGKQHLAPGGKIVVMYPKAKTARLVAFAEPEGFALVERTSVNPKSLKLWLTCAMYMELFFDAHLHVFIRDPS